ncbi:hypothetical protein ACH7OW_004432 [Escherichia coli]
MEIKPEDELSNIVLFPVKEDDPRNQVNFLYEPSERPYCHHASVRVDEKERQEEQERRKNIEKLIQIERNAKARIRRATKSRTE